MVSEKAIGTYGAIPDGYSEVNVEFFQFLAENDTLAGRLLSKSTTNVRGNRVGRYTIVKDGGEKVAFLGGVHLDELLSAIGLGREIILTFTHREKTQESGFEIKKFRLLIKGQG